MRGPTFLAGTLLGGALVAACLSDSFRDKCREVIIGAGNELNKQLADILHEVTGKPITKEEKANDEYDGR